MSLWSDQSGAVLSTEAVMLTAVVGVGVTVGMRQLASAVNESLQEISVSISEVGKSYRDQVKSVLPQKKSEEQKVDEQTVTTAAE